MLDAENYQKLESGTSSKWRSSSLLNSSGTFNTDELKNSDQIEDENWSQLDKTIYAYKEFAEMYEKYGIAGNIIYIDGFKCELPDEEYQAADDDSNSNADTEADENNSNTDSNSEKPSGKPLTKNDFNVSSSALEDENELIQTKYEKDDEYKLASKKVTERLNAESEVKDMASYAIEASNLTFIKEGTVIGRTFTDKEIVEDLRGENYEDYIKSGEEDSNTASQGANNSSEEEQKNKLIGNYLRIIMRDLDDTVVENVEDYMKLDDGESKKENTDVNWDFYYWMPYESGVLGEKGVPSHEGPGSCETISGPSEVACGIAQWTSTTKDGGCNNIADLCAWLAEEDPSLCSSLKAFSSYSESQVCASFSSLQAAWWSVNDKDTERFLELQMEYFYEKEFKGWLEEYGTGFLEEKEMVTQGTYASLMNWGPNLGWETCINASMSDEQIVKALLTYARPISSTCGTLEQRWDSQYVLAKDILSGAFTEVEDWVRTAQPADKYGNGQNPGALFSNLILNNNIYGKLCNIWKYGVLLNY